MPFKEGIELLGGLGTAIAVTVPVLLIIVGNYRVNNLHARVAPDATEPGGVTSYKDLLQVMPLETVFTEWRALTQSVSIPPDQQHSFQVAQVRTLLLDEMQRRDPVGFARWLDDGAVDPPGTAHPGRPGPDRLIALAKSRPVQLSR